MSAPGDKRDVSILFTARSGYHQVLLMCSLHFIPQEQPPLLFSPGGGDKPLMHFPMEPNNQQHFSLP